MAVIRVFMNNQVLGLEYRFIQNGLPLFLGTTIFLRKMRFRLRWKRKRHSDGRLKKESSTEMVSILGSLTFRNFFFFVIPDYLEVPKNRKLLPSQR